MNILMIVSNAFTHDPRVYNEAKTLVSRGHSVTVIGWDRKSQSPASEMLEGIEVVRMRNNRYMNLLRYDFMRLRPWWRQAYRLALKLHQKRNFQVVHCHDLDTLPTGVMLKKKLGIKLVFDAHEIWGYMVEKDFPAPVAEHFIRKERKLARHADMVITVNDALERHFRKITDREIVIVMNCKSPATENYQPPGNKRFTALYIGSLGKARFLKEVIESARELPDMDFIIGGIGDPEFARELESACASTPNAKFIGQVPFSEVMPMTRSCDVVLCVFDPSNRNNMVGLPNKVFEAMACGRPVVVTRGTFSGEFVEKQGCGLAVDYAGESFRNAMSRMAGDRAICEEMGRKGLKASLEEFNWKKQEEKLAGAYEKICADV